MKRLIELGLQNRLVWREWCKAKILNYFALWRDKRWNSLQGRYQGNGIFAFWCTSQRNFGDLITPFLLKKYGFTPVLSAPSSSQFAAAGSIIEMLGNDYRGVILGSGLLRQNSRMQLPNAKVVAVRGQLTRDLIGLPKNTILGDPGLLISDHLSVCQKKKYRLGIIPHYQDMANNRVHMLRRKNFAEICLINVLRSPEVVAHDIDCCENVISSSLHGLVVADALGIPNRWAVLSNRVLGQGFKFRDYYSALHVSRVPISLGGNETVGELIDHVYPPGERVSELRSGLRYQFEHFKLLL